MLWSGLTRPNAPVCGPLVSKLSAQEMILPWRTRPAARLTTAGVMKFSVPISSSLPHRSQLRNRLQYSSSSAGVTSGRFVIDTCPGPPRGCRRPSRSRRGWRRSSSSRAARSPPARRPWITVRHRGEALDALVLRQPAADAAAHVVDPLANERLLLLEVGLVAHRAVAGYQRLSAQAAQVIERVEPPGGIGLLQPRLDLAEDVVAG